VSAQQKVIQAFPEEFNYSRPDYLERGFATVMSECTGAYPNGRCNVSLGMQGFGGSNHWDMRNLILDSIKYGSGASVKWIIAQDDHCGPNVDPGYETNTAWTGRPFVTVPTKCMTAGSACDAETDVLYNQEFWTWALVSNFLPASLTWPQSSATPPIRRVSHDAKNVASGLDFAAEFFFDEATSTMTAVIDYNGGEELPVSIELDSNNSIDITLGKSSTTVVRWSSTTTDVSSHAELSRQEKSPVSAASLIIS